MIAHKDSYTQLDFFSVSPDWFDEEYTTTNNANEAVSGMSRLLPTNEHTTTDEHPSSCSCSFLNMDVPGNEIDYQFRDDQSKGRHGLPPAFCSFMVTHEFDERFRDGLGLPSLTQSFGRQPDSHRADTIVRTPGTVDLRCQGPNKNDTLLPSSFVPGPYSVIIGRGKECKGAIGNERLRVLASTFLQKYASALNKASKSKVVSTIVSMIREACPIGAFIRLGKDGRWCEVKQAVATEKVGYTMRELLGDRYKSSSKSKARLRRSSLEPNGDEEASLSSSTGLSDESLSSTISDAGSNRLELLPDIM